MVLSQREKYIAIGVGAVLGLLVLNQFVVEPWQSNRDDLITKQEAAQKKIHDAKTLFHQRREAELVMAAMVKDGLKSDTSDAQYQLSQNVREWGQQAGLTTVAIHPDRPASEGKNYQRVNVRYTATGPEAAIARLLFRLEKAQMPMRVSEIQVTSRKEGTDDLQVVMNIETLCPVPEKNDKNGKASTAVTTVAQAPGDRS